MNRIIIFVLLVSALTCFAQETVYHSDRLTATLQVGDETTVFYGIYAFCDAYNAAPVEGATITLSSGVFEGINQCNKSISIYGVGFDDEIISNSPLKIVEKTLIKGCLIFNKNGRNDVSVRLEGLGIESHIYVNDVVSFNMLRCGMNDLRFDEGFTTTAHCVQCKIWGRTNTRLRVKSMIFDNCIISSFFNNENDDKSQAYFNHCIIFYYSCPVALYDNCIISGGVRGGTTCRNCVFRNGASSDSQYINCQFNVDSYDLFGKDDIFGGMANESYHLTTPSLFMGNDGTEVGIWGGEYGFETIPSIPRILNSDVARTLDENGKLTVTLEAESRPRPNL